MKVGLKFNQKYYSGNLDGLVYYYNPKLKMMIARRKPERGKPNPASSRLAEINKNLKALNPSLAYRGNLTLYIELAQNANVVRGLTNWYSLYMKIMWSLKRKYPQSIDLKTISKEQIHSGDLSCRSIKAAVEDGLIPPVKGYELLDALI
ncbi:MAG: hypothetical protein PHI68_03345 [Candidatus Cloacimonetes bacterium]|nr:hypothetical protein [Candidatus Cloacimonadota bacterium]